MTLGQFSSRALKVSWLALAAAITPSIAAAQAASTTASTAASTESNEIVVTGTSIRGVAGAGSQLVAVGREEMIESGLATSTDVARALPQTINLGADESRRGGSQDAAANRTATSGINLRGLSGEATLLLVNGRRLAANGTIKAIADPSVVPALALQRIEVVPDGSSAIYGADAVAGVVNLVTRKPSDSAETVVRYGAGDGIDQKQFGQMISRDWDGGGFLLAYEYNFRSNLEAKDRWYLSNDLRSRGGTDQRSNLAAPGNIVSGANRYPLPNGTGKGLTAGQLAIGTPNKFDAGLYGDALPEQKRHSTFLTANQKLTDRLEAYYEGYYSARDFYEYVTPASSSLTVPRTNPFYVNPASATATSVTVEYRFIDANGGASWSGYDDSAHQVAGLRFDMGGDWQIDGYVGHNINRARARTQDLLNLLAVPAALADTNPATALNVFGNGDPANNNPATLARIQGLRDSYTTNKGLDFVAKADGPLFSIPGGQVRMAVGAEHHITKLKYRIMSSIKNANNDLLLDRLRESDRDSDAFFAEAAVPIVGEANAMPGIQALNLQVAARYEQYSDFGDTTNPKVGLTWTPVQDLTVRGSWGTSFRAPSLIDASDAVFNIFIQSFTDPSLPAGSPQIRGIFMNGGDPNLKPEKADTWSLGFDLRPSWLEGAKASVTYYNIAYTDVVDLVAANTALANPSIYGFLIERNPSLARVQSLLSSPNLESTAEPASTLTIIMDGRRHNLGSINQDGLDIDVGYRFTTPVGDISLDSNVTKILNQTRSVAPGLPFTDVLNIINFPVSLRARSSVGWRANGFSANLFWNRVGSYTNNTVTPNVEIEAYDTFDASVGYTFDKDGPGLLRGVRMALNAQNLSDEEPPVVINGASGWDSQNASPIGRMVSFEIRKAW